jgi:hypothetical protein
MYRHRRSPSETRRSIKPADSSTDRWCAAALPAVQPRVGELPERPIAEEQLVDDAESVPVAERGV